MVEESIRKHFKEMFSGQNRNLGKLEGANASADALGCRGQRDHLFLYLIISNDKIFDIKFECAMCDPTMFVIADILCNTVKGMDLSGISKIQKDNLFNQFGEKSEDIFSHWDAAIKVLMKAASDYQIQCSK